MFYSHTQAEVLSSMEDMKNMLNGLRRTRSALSLRSVASFAPSVKTKEALKQLCRDLYRGGVTADNIRDRKDQAVTFFQHLNAPTADNLVIPQTAGSVAIVQPLVERQKGKGRNPALRIESTSLRGITGPVLRVAAAMGLKQSVQPLLEAGTTIKASRSNDEATLLNTAASNGNVGMVRQLLENGENIEGRRSDDGPTPLLTAARHGHTELVRLLLEKGANIEAFRSSGGSTPLHTAGIMDIQTW